MASCSSANEKHDFQDMVVRSFQLKAGLHCSKSPVFNCFRCKAAGQPVTARGSGFSGATGGRLMKRRQEVCASTAWRSIFVGVLLALLVLGWTTVVSAQVNTATLSGTVLDPQNLA